VDNYHLSALLNEGQIRQAKKDILRCRLKERERDILLKIMDRVWVSELAREYQLNRQNIYQIRKAGLVKIWRELGPREWIRAASKGKIEEWNIALSHFLSAK
jgi:hypothetical protein